MNRRIISALLTCLYVATAYGQPGEYLYKRELNGIADVWHTVTLPDEVFSKLSPDFSDIRMYGFTSQNDTVEAPYVLQVARGRFIDRPAEFRIINPSRGANGYYFTFEIPAVEPINEIRLTFEQQNFDWRLALEGSQDNQQWYTIVDDYRILSIQNDRTSFQYTKVSFPYSSYRYYRVRIDSREKPGLLSAGIRLQQEEGASYREYRGNVSVRTNKKERQTEIDLELADIVPVSYLKVHFTDSLDYYRPVTISYLYDSVKTDVGWQYAYHTLTSGTLSSFEENVFVFNSTLLKRIKITIHNDDNAPLSFGSVTAKGYVHSLVARFREPATYFLYYGNAHVSKPRYDLGLFTDKIPVAMTSLVLGNEQSIVKKAAPPTEPLFVNERWLWGIMTLIMVILAGFSIKMIRKD